MRHGEADPAQTATAASSAPAVVATDDPGAVLGRFRIERELGAGAIGVVHAAFDPDLERWIALKVLRKARASDEARERLLREARAMARLAHPNVVTVYEVGTVAGRDFIAMELIHGETLADWLRVSPRSPAEILDTFLAAGRGLAAAHAAGIVHRDFKPHNVLRGRDGRIAVTDFGLARDSDGELPPALDDTQPVGSASRPRSERAELTMTGALIGTPAYMAPEQWRGDAITPETDQFAYCVALWEALSGERPYRGPSIEELRRQIAGGPTALDASRIPRRLHGLLRRGLDPDPARRWPSMEALLDALGRGRRGRRLGAIAAVAGIAAVAAGAAAVVTRLGPERGRRASCAELARQSNDAATILVCKDEYARTSDPKIGLELTNALRRTGKLQDAAIVASELLVTPVRSDALRMLGKIADREGHRDDAARSFRLASQLHREQQRWADSAADLQALAGVLNDFIDQLVVLEQAADDAHRGGDSRVEALCDLASARILSEIGAGTGAQAELDRAAPLITRPSDVVQLDRERGSVHQNLGEDALAIAELERARVGAEAVTNRLLALAASENLVYSFAELGRVPDAARLLTVANALDPGDHDRAIRLSLEARIAEHSGDLPRAAALTEQAVAATDPGATDDLIERHTERAEIALRRDELAVAEQSARRAIALIEAGRSTEPPVELRSWMITDHRIPYQLLFAVLARRGDAAGALEVFDRYRGLAVLAGLARGDGSAAPAPAAAYPVEDLARLVPLLQASPLASPAPERMVRDAVRDASLLVLAVAHAELWRITAQDGRLEVASLGPIAALQPQIDRLRTAPDDRAVAAALGTALVPPALARPGDRVLHVVLDEPLVGLPLAALRVGDRRLIAMRPIVRSARVADLGCAAAPGGPQRVVVIGDLADTGRRFPVVTPGATRSALLDAARSDLLHITVPVAADALDDALVLRDGRVRSLEIAGHGAAAGRVVLLTSQTGPAGSAGLAMAFLAAGADQVIATLGPVPRAALDRLADRLYRSDSSDLVRALARIQATPDAREDDGSWLRVEAFGRERCHPRP